MKAPERRIYPRAPIVEAVIDFRHDSDSSVDEVLRSLRTSLGTKYTGEPRKQNRFEISATVEGDAVKSTAETRPHMTFLRSADGLRLIGCAPRTLSIHVLAPYPGWERFLEQAQEAVHALPPHLLSANVTAVAVRYIDRIALPDGNASRFISIMPKRPGSMPAQLTAFHVVTQAEDPADGTTAMLTIASAHPGPDGKTVMIYDLNVQRIGASLCRFDDSQWVPIVEALHKRQREIFEDSITDDMRKLFE